MNHKYSFLLLVLFIQVPFIINAQEIKGTVLCDNQPVPCNAILCAQGDSSIIAGGFFIDGEVELTNPTSHKVYLILSGLQFKDTTIAVPFQNQYHLGEITVQRRVLEEVVIKGKREAYEVKSDGYVLNVSRSYLKELGMATDVLRMSPMVMVKSDESIYIIGKEKTPLVLIDGKKIYDLEQIKTLPSSSIREIKIVTNPTARYDANITSVIEITTKENSYKGLTGRVDASIGKGEDYLGKESVNLSYNGKNIKVFGGFKLSQTNKSPHIENLTEVYSISDTTTLYSENTQYQKWRNKSYTTGIDYRINKNNTIGIQISGFNKNVNNEDSWENKRDLWGIYSVSSTSKLKQDRLGINLNHQVKFKDNDRQLNSFFDYLIHEQNSTENISEYYQYDSNVLRNFSDSKYQIYSLKSEYSHAIKESKLDMIFGIKISQVEGEGNLVFEEEVNGNWEASNRLSNMFSNNEDIIATYADISKELSEKLSINFGLRGEYIKRYASDSYQNVPIIDTSYFRLYPSFQFLYAISHNHKLSIDYINKTQRPPYGFLTQSIAYLDSTRYFQGNPYLTPAYINDFSLQYTFRKRYGTIIKFQHINKIIDVDIFYDTNNKLKTTYSNYDKFRKWSLTMFGSHTFDKINLRSSLVLSKPIMEVMQLEEQTTISNIGFYMDFSAGVDVWKNGNLHIKYYYSKNEQYGASVRNDMSSLSIGMTQKLLSDKLTLRFAANDILANEKYGGSRFVGTIKEQREEFQDTRTFTFSLSFRFNNYKSVRRKSGLDDEKYRL